MQQFKEKTGICECIPTNIWPSCFVRAVVKNRIFFHLFRTVRTLSERYGQLKEDFQNVQESHRNHSDPDGITKQLQSTIDSLKIVARTAQQRLSKKEQEVNRLNAMIENQKKSNDTRQTGMIENKKKSNDVRQTGKFLQIIDVYSLINRIQLHIFFNQVKT